MDTAEVFDKFQLDLLEKDWINKLWPDSFSEPLDLPTEYECYLQEVEVEKLFVCAINILKDWLSIPSGSNEDFNSNETDERDNVGASFSNKSFIRKSWQMLIENNVQHKALVCLLSVFIQKGKTNCKSKKARLLCVKATSLYFILIAIPGSIVYRVFNPVLYTLAIEAIKLCCISVFENTISKSKNSKRGLHVDDDYSSEGSSEFIDGDENLQTNDKQTDIENFSLLLKSLIFLLENFQLEGQEESLEITIKILILITRLEKTSESVVVCSPLENSVSYVAHKAYTALKMLCSTDHGDVQETVRLIMKELLLGLTTENLLSMKLTNKEAIVIKNHSVMFICYVLKTVKEPAYLGVKALVQNLCRMTPNKTEAIENHAGTVIEVIGTLPNELYSEIVIWFMKLCHSDEVKDRIIGLYLVHKLLCLNGRTLHPFNHLNQNNEEMGSSNYTLRHFSNHKFLLGAVFSRCQDISPAVKGKAVAFLANIILSNNKYIKPEMEKMFMSEHTNTVPVKSDNICKNGFFPFQEFIMNIGKYSSNQVIDPLPRAEAVIKYLEKCINNSSVFVRKSAIQALTNICILDEKWMTDELLQLLVDTCKNISVSVRKLLIQRLTDLLTKYSNNKMCSYWVQGLLPLIRDQEIKSQEKVLEALQTVLLDNIVAYNKMSSHLHAMPWKLLRVMLKLNMSKLFLFACQKWTLNNNIKQSLIAKIKSHIGTENNIPAWYLLSSFSKFVDLEEIHFVMEYFLKNVHYKLQVNELSSTLVTEVLHLNWHKLSDSDQLELCQHLLTALCHFTVPLFLIAYYIDMCHLITKANATSQEQERDRVKEWAGQLIELAENILARNIGPDCPALSCNEDYVCQLIFTIGDASQICPDQLKHSTVLLIQNLLQKPDGGEDPNRWKGRVSSKVKAVSVVTLGKLCLQNEQTAKMIVPLLADQLSTRESAEVKNNVMVALSDICIRFASMVEGYIPDMCICLGDENPLVREKTLMILMKLIQEDYLKVRSPLLFHFLTMLVDDVAIIREQMTSFMLNTLLIKNKNLIVQYFIESLFYFNEYNSHPKFSRAAMNDRERKAFSLAGVKKQEKRRSIYRFMLEHLTDDQRLKIMFELCKDILSGIVQDQISLKDSGKLLFQDALYVLSSKGIKIAHQTDKNSSDVEEEVGEEEQRTKALNKLARKTVVTQVMKVAFIENVIPIFISLKQKLRKIKSYLINDLYVCLKELMKDFKNEINEILAADEELAAEITFDLQNEEQFEVTRTSDQMNEEAVRRSIVKLVAQNGSRLQAAGSAAFNSSTPNNIDGVLSSQPVTKKHLSVSPLLDLNGLFSPGSNRDPSLSPVVNASPSLTSSVHRSPSRTSKSNRSSSSVSPASNKDILMPTASSAEKRSLNSKSPCRKSMKVQSPQPGCSFWTTPKKF